MKLIFSVDTNIHNSELNARIYVGYHTVSSGGPWGTESRPGRHDPVLFKMWIDLQNFLDTMLHY
jgi:hypothetical protein